MSDGSVISIHAPLTGSDSHCFWTQSGTGISIHAPLTGSDQGAYENVTVSYISIHAPLTGSDASHLAHDCKQTDFNPRSPYGERPKATSNRTNDEEFQSTLPLRGATGAGTKIRIVGVISIHAPLTGSDQIHFLAVFQPLVISIHAPLTGSDRSTWRLCSKHPNFNPRSPYGERRRAITWVHTITLFQSTLPLRGATHVHRSAQRSREFQSTLPLRGATDWKEMLKKGFEISIHAPLTGSDTASV